MPQLILELVLGCETAIQAQLRFVRAVKRVRECYRDDTVAIVAHGTVIALFAAHYAGEENRPTCW